MGSPEVRLREEYLRLRASGIALVRAGDHRRAAEEFGAALALAKRLKDQATEHEAQANLSMTWLQLGEDHKAEAGLREILLTSRNPRTRFGAAYNLAISQRKRGRYDRARFYAANAMESARKLRDGSNRAACHNLAGNILMNQGRLDEALAEYRKALRIRRRQKADTRFSVAILLENIGYTLLLKKRFRSGAGSIVRALELAKEAGARRCEAECYQDLCYAWLRMGRYAAASGFGEQALRIAEEYGYLDVTKNCHYLLGEAAHLDGRVEERERHFGDLQKMHPEVPFLRDFLCSFDISEILTLKR